MNNPAANLKRAFKGIFYEEIEKARKEGKPLPVAMFLLGENRGEKGGLFAEVHYDDGRKIKQLVEGIALPTLIKLLIKDENKLGPFTSSEKGTLRDEFGLTEFDEQTRTNKMIELFPYFNTASFMLSVDGLLELFNLSEDYDKNTSFEEVVRRVDKITHRLPTYMDLKTETESGLSGYQFERIYGDITTVAPWIAVVVDRARNFAP